MSGKEAAKTGREMFERLMAFVEDIDEDIQSMSAIEINAYLEEEAIDVNAGYQELKSKLSAIRGQWRLADARRKMNEFREAPPCQTKELKEQPKDVMAEIKRLLVPIKNTQPVVAQVYFRKLEGATEKDLQSILNALQLLDVIGEIESE